MNLTSITRHEWRLLSSEGALWLAAALLLAAVGYAVTNGIGFRGGRLADVEATTEADRAHLEAERRAVIEGAEAGFSGRAGSATTHAVLPPGPLADFAIGQSELYPYSAEIGMFGRSDNLFREYQLQSPLTLLSGRFDLAFVVIYLLPLLLLVLSYNLLSSEKEGGTLALTLSQPVSLRQLFTGKLLARAALVLGLIAALSVVALALTGDLGSERLLRFSLFLAVTLAYGLFWLGLVALVAAAGRRSETCAMALACLWLLFVLVIPALLNVVVETARPAPSRLAYVSEMRAASADAAKQSTDLLATYYEDHPELAAEEMQQGFLPAYFAQQREIERRVEPIVGGFESELAAQQRLVRLLSVLSPAVLVQETLNDVAGTGLERQRRYVEQAREFLASWNQLLTPKVFTDADMEAADYDALPAFRFEEEPVSGPVGRTLVAVGILLAIALVLFVWAVRRLDRYQIAS